jgi:hypothetical protein
MPESPSAPFAAPVGFKPDARPEKILVAVKRAVERIFDAGKWKELAYVLGHPEVLDDHPRLLRSLNWGDDDYPSNVFNVLRELVGGSFENLGAVVEFVDLREWIRTNDAKLFAELCEDAVPLIPLEQCENVGEIHNIGELGRHAARIRSGLEDGSDPELAIGSAKELLESVLKTVLGDHGQKPTEDIPTLLKRAQKELDLDPNATLPGADSLKRTLSNLGQVVVGVAELRTLYGTGHGRSKSHELALAHARLVVNAAISISTFLLELWQEKQGYDPTRND